MPTYVFGHKNPDSDSIVGAISLSYLKNQLGENCIATRQGEISPETEFILNRFNGKLPELKTSVAGEKVYIVDYSDKAQAPKDIMQATILGIVDHHKLGDLTTNTPLECWIRPVGCSNTIIKEMYDSHGVSIPKDIAGMMVCAILSDTVMFKSPTSTKTDIKACEALAEIAGIEDYQALGMEMLTVKSAVEGATPRQLITRDYKEFDMGGQTLGIGQLEVIDLAVFDGMYDEFFVDMKKLKEEHGLHSVILLLTDVIKEGSQLLAVSDDESKLENAFKCTLENSQVWLEGVLSRKKQVIPYLQPQFGSES